jgi:hypothetical protein
VPIPGRDSSIFDVVNILGVQALGEGVTESGVQEFRSSGVQEFRSQEFSRRRKEEEGRRKLPITNYQLPITNYPLPIT